MNIHLLKMEKLKTSPLPSAPRSVPRGVVCKRCFWGGEAEAHKQPREHRAVNVGAAPPLPPTTATLRGINQGGPRLGGLAGPPVLGRG